MSSYNPSNGSIFRTEYPEKTAPNNEAIIMNNDTMEINLIFNNTGTAEGRKNMASWLIPRLIKSPVTIKLIIWITMEDIMVVF